MITAKPGSQDIVKDDNKKMPQLASTVTKPVQQTKRQINLSIDQLLPVNIKPKVHCNKLLLKIKIITL